MRLVIVPITGGTKRGLPGARNLPGRDVQTCSLIDFAPSAARRRDTEPTF
jgi:hypothetical protein